MGLDSMKRTAEDAKRACESIGLLSGQAEEFQTHWQDWKSGTTRKRIGAHFLQSDAQRVSARVGALQTLAISCNLKLAGNAVWLTLARWNRLVRHAADGENGRGCGIAIASGGGCGPVSEFLQLL